MKQKAMKATRTSKYEDVQNNNNKKRIVYEDELDGTHEYEPQSPSEDGEPKKIIKIIEKNMKKKTLLLQKLKNQ